MTSGSSASIGCVRIGVAERADCCGRGAKGGTAPNVGWERGGFTACEVVVGQRFVRCVVATCDASYLRHIELWEFAFEFFNVVV
jgi:hypothetical protein